MKLVALDQSTKITGYSIWNDKQFVRCGILKVDDKKSCIERLADMYECIKVLFDEEVPDYVGFEATQYQNNLRAYSQLSQLQGIIMALMIERELPFVIIEASAWKREFGVQGKKRQEQKESTVSIANSKFNIDASEDEADSIGIGSWMINNVLTK